MGETLISVIINLQLKLSINYHQILYCGENMSQTILYQPLPQAVPPPVNVSDNLTLDISPVTVEMTKDGYRAMIIVVVIFLFIVIAFTIGWAVYVANKNSMQGTTATHPMSFPKPKFNLDSMPGAVGNSAAIPGQFYNTLNCQGYKDQLTCQSSDTRFWNNAFQTTGKCVCAPPFWGPLGNRESYDIRYHAIGSVDSSIATYDILETEVTNRLSFPQTNLPGWESQTLCTPLCDGNTSCIGVIWNKDTPTGASGICQLLTNDLTVLPGKNIPYSVNVDGNLFLKEGVNPRFIDRVFLYNGVLRPRYWLRERNVLGTNPMVTVYQNQVTRMVFNPQRYLNDGNLTGVYSNKEFTLTEAYDAIVNQDPSFYIHHPGERLEIPPTWRIVWVTYLQYP
jgi:hypothetical protein